MSTAATSASIRAVADIDGREAGWARVIRSAERCVFERLLGEAAE